MIKALSIKQSAVHAGSAWRSTTTTTTTTRTWKMFCLLRYKY